MSFYCFLDKGKILTELQGRHLAADVTQPRGLQTPNVIHINLLFTTPNHCKSHGKAHKSTGGLSQ